MRSFIFAAAVLVACTAEEAAVPRAAEPAQVRRLQVVTLGDSLAYGAGDDSGGGGIAGRLRGELERRGVAEVDVVNLGINGAQTADLIGRLRQERIRSAVASANAVVLSIGANDLFRTESARQETLRAPLQVADQVLDRVEQIVTTLRGINPAAEILILGGYNPVPNHPYASLITDYLRLWDITLAERFADDRRVAVVQMSDIVNQQRLSRYDNFHPGGAAYDEASKRIASILLEEVKT